METGAEEFWFSELMVNCIIWGGNLVAFTAWRFNFYKFKSIGLHESWEKTIIFHLRENTPCLYIKYHR
jgi:hypothetical protein